MKINYRYLFYKINPKIFQDGRKQVKKSKEKSILQINRLDKLLIFFIKNRRNVFKKI